MKLNNKYYILRHGEAKSNVKEIVSCWPEKFKNSLTVRGRKMIKDSAQRLLDILEKSENEINFIYTSPLLRTRETAEIVGKKLKIKPKIDKRLSEINFGIFNGEAIKKMWGHFKREEDRIKNGPPKGENYKEIVVRVSGFLRDIDKKYKNKNILIVSHEGPLVFLEGVVMGISIEKTIKKFPAEKRIHKGEIRELN